MTQRSPNTENSEDVCLLYVCTSASICQCIGVVIFVCDHYKASIFYIKVILNVKHIIRETYNSIRGSSETLRFWNFTDISIIFPKMQTLK